MIKFSDEKYKEYRRVYPVLRISYSLYKYWIVNNWYEVWNYLAGFQYYKSAPMTLGSEVHEWIEKNGVPEWLDSMVDGEEVLIEDKLVLGIDIENPNKKLTDFEKKLDYAISGIPDVRTNNYIVDWKVGGISGYEKQLNLYSWLAKKLYGVDKCNRNIVIGIEPIFDEKGQIKTVRKRKTHEYEVNDKWLNEWEYVFDEMANSIKKGIAEGEFDDFISNHYF